MPSSEDLLFGRLAMSRNLVTREELAAALQEQERRRLAEGVAPKLGEVLVAMGLITEVQIGQLLGEQSGAAGGKMLGGYELLSRVGSGGMGTVYRARQVSLNRIVALKVLPQRLAKDGDFLARFYREARAVARLNHPNIVGGFDVGQADGYHYLAMEFVEGTSAAALLAESATGLPYRQVLDIARQTARALAHAHENGLIHRDIKPENILISPSGAVKLCDLGLARFTAKEDLSITQMGIAVGTPHYISPEQARGEQDPDPRTDVYSLGASLFHLATGRPVFTGDNAMQIMLKHLHEPPPAVSEVAPAVPAEFSAVIAKCLAKRREERYPTMQALLQDLELVAAGRRPAHAELVAPGAAHPGRPAAPTHRTQAGRTDTRVMQAVVERRRRPTRIIAAVGGICALVLGLTILVAGTQSGPGGGSGDGPPPVAARPAGAGPEHGPGPERGPEAAPDKAREFFEAAFKFAQDYPQDYRRQIELFGQVTAVAGAESLWTRRAKVRIAHAEEELRKVVEAALEPVRREAAGLRAQKKYAAAAERFSRLPAELRDEPSARAAAEKAAGELRAAGLAEWAELLARARKLSGDEDFVGARAALEAARPFELPAVALELDRELGALAETEQSAAGRARQKAAGQYAAFRQDFRKLLAGRKYAEAARLAEAKRKELPADLAAKVAVEQVDLETLRGVSDQALSRLKKAQLGDRLTVAGVTGRFELPADPRGRKVFDGENFQLLRKVGADDEMGHPFKFSELSTADVLVLAGLAEGGRTREDAERALLFTVFDGTPAADALQAALGTARMRGLDTSRFDGLLPATQAGGRDREAAEEFRRLEGLVSQKRWEEVLASGKRLTEGYAETQTLKTRGAQVTAWVSQARGEIAARNRVEFAFQDGEAAPALGVSCYTGTSDAVLMGNVECCVGKGPLLSLFGKGVERTAVRFDLSAVPKDTVVESARLELYCQALSYDGGNSKVHAYRLTSEWVEGTRTWAVGPDMDGANWKQRSRDAAGAALAWTTPGGDYDAAANHGRGPGILDTFDGPAVGNWLKFNVTPAVRDWVSGKAANCGLLLVSEPKAAGGGGGIKMPSREAILQFADKRPRLVLAVSGLRASPAPPEAPVAEQVYQFDKAADVAAFKAAVRILRGGRQPRPAVPVFSGKFLEMDPDQRSWTLDTGRQWGRDLEVALKVTLPDGARANLDLGGALPDSGAKSLVFWHSLAYKSVSADFRTTPDWSNGPGVKDSLGIGSQNAAEAMKVLLSPEGAYELRFTKRGARLRLECQGLVFAEMVLSPRDEQELAGRTVRLMLATYGAAKSAGPVRVGELRLGPIRPRPAPPNLEDTRN